MTVRVAWFRVSQDELGYDGEIATSGGQPETDRDTGAHCDCRGGILDPALQERFGFDDERAHDALLPDMRPAGNERAQVGRPQILVSQVQRVYGQLRRSKRYAAAGPRRNAVKPDRPELSKSQTHE